MGAASKKLVQLENGKTVYIGSNSYPVSKDRFMRVCQDNALTFMEISRQIGYTSNAITSALQSGYFNNVMIKGIENVFGIKYEQYAYIQEVPVQKPAEQPEEKPVQQSMIPESALYDTIKAAVTDAINEALAGNMKNLRGMIYTAIYTACNAVKKETA